MVDSTMKFCMGAYLAVNLDSPSLSIVEVTILVAFVYVRIQGIVILSNHKKIFEPTCAYSLEKKIISLELFGLLVHSLRSARSWRMQLDKVQLRPCATLICGATSKIQHACNSQTHWQVGSQQRQVAFLIRLIAISFHFMKCKMLMSIKLPVT